MGLKNLLNCFCDNTTTKGENVNDYARLLGFESHFDFVLSKSKVKDQTEFDTLSSEAEMILAQDLKRCQMEFEKISPMLKNRLIGSIGSMTIIGDDDGKISVKFHKRNDKNLWDGKSKKYPEKGITAKYKHEIFFILEDEEE